MKTRTRLPIALVIAAMASACVPKTDTANPDKIVACTEEAKVCEDGSTVAREGPNCEFAACPGEAPLDANKEPAAEALEADKTDVDEAETEAEEAK